MSTPIPPTSYDWLGWAAALLTLLTFACRDMRRLRLLALAANAAFIAYGALANLLPVLVLHLALVPVNLWRFNQARRAGLPAASAAAFDLPTRLLRRPRAATRTRRARTPRRSPSLTERSFP